MFGLKLSKYQYLHALDVEVRGSEIQLQTDKKLNLII